jgi:beta-glucosidase
MTSTPATSLTGLWHDTAASPFERASALLAEMTPAERVAQIGSSWPGSENTEELVAPLQDTHGQAASFDDEIKNGLGHITRPFGTAPIEPDDGMRRLADLQHQVVAANRFGIPAIAHEECLTGFTAWKATVYPTPLAWAATFNPALIEEMASRIGADMNAVGIHQGLAPVLDVVRDYRWGRVEETMGEDPYLVSETGAAYVRGLQHGGVDATLKHFIGYSASRGGRNHAPVSVGPRELRDVLLPPFEKAIRAAGVASVMNSYTETDGVPAASDPELFTRLLRDELGFTGTVVSDYWAIAFLVSMHRIVGDTTAAAALSLSAGIDVELPHTIGYDERLLENVSIDLVDRAALRVLEQKARLGLLDSDWTPLEPRAIDLDSAANRSIARRVAEESVVLLKNENTVLPLAAPRRIAVVGPVADEARSFFGCYAFPNHVMPHATAEEYGVEAVTVVDAVRAEFPDASVTFATGTSFLGADRTGIAEAVALAEAADVVILAVGDKSGMFGLGTSGEGCDVIELELPGQQRSLAEAVLDAGTPVVLLTVSGRPYAIGDLVSRAAGALQVFLPGEEGGTAIAGVLSGRVEPGGRLPVQIPGSSAAQPGTYLAPPLALKSDGVSNIDPTPAFPFGFGLGYAQVEITDATEDASTIPTDGRIEITVTVTNRGARRGVAVPQLYLTDPIAEVTRPVRQLVGFHRVEVAAGESAVVRFDVSADLAAYTRRDLKRVVEAGSLVLTVASDARDEGIPIEVRLVGDTRIVDSSREMSTRVWTS